MSEKSVPYWVVARQPAGELVIRAVRRPGDPLAMLSELAGVVGSEEDLAAAVAAVAGRVSESELPFAVRLLALADSRARARPGALAAKLEPWERANRIATEVIRKPLSGAAATAAPGRLEARPVEALPGQLEGKLKEYCAAFNAKLEALLARMKADLGVVRVITENLQEVLAEAMAAYAAGEYAECLALLDALKLDVIQGWVAEQVTDGGYAWEEIQRLNQENLQNKEDGSMFACEVNSQLIGEAYGVYNALNLNSPYGGGGGEGSFPTVLEQIDSLIAGAQRADAANSTLTQLSQCVTLEDAFWGVKIRLDEDCTQALIVWGKQNGNGWTGTIVKALVGALLNQIGGGLPATLLVALISADFLAFFQAIEGIDRGNGVTINVSLLDFASAGVPAAALTEAGLVLYSEVKGAATGEWWYTPVWITANT